MKMTPRQIMGAYRAIQELANCVLPYKTTRAVHKLRHRLQDEFDAILKTEQNMVEKYDGKTVDGTYRFPTAELAETFHKEYTEFITQEDDINLPQVDVSKCLDAIRISSAAIEVLEGLVDFGEA